MARQPDEEFKNHDNLKANDQGPALKKNSRKGVNMAFYNMNEQLSQLSEIKSEMSYSLGVDDDASNTEVEN